MSASLLPLLGARRLGWLALSLTTMTAACGRSTDAGTPDTALARDLTLAASAGQRATPPIVLADTALAPASAATVTAPTPAPTPVSAPAARSRPPSPRPESTTVASAPVTTSLAADSAPAAAPTAAPAAAAKRIVFGTGTTMALATTQAICTTTNRLGDRFVATLTEPVTGDAGASLAVGTSVMLELASTTTGADGKARMEFLARGVMIDGFYRPLNADVSPPDGELQRDRVPTPGAPSDRGKVARGAITGAILGQIFSRGAKGAIIGAAAGAAASAASSAASHPRQVQGCLPRGATVRLRLTAPLMPT